MVVALSVTETFEEDKPGTFGKTGPVGRGGESLATTIRSKPTLSTELREHGRRGHHSDTTGQRQRALPLAQRLRGKMHSHQRRRASRVDRDRGAFETEDMGHSTRRRAGRAADTEQPL